MDKLPTELLDMIFEHTDFNTVKAVRLVCRSLNKSTSALLFKDVYMVLCTDHLRKLQHIASDPNLKDLVKTFTFHSELLPPFDTFDDWEKLIDLREPFSKLEKRRLHEERERKGEDLSSDEEAAVRKDTHEEFIGMPRYGKTRTELDYHFKRYQEIRQQQLDWDGDREGAAFREAFCQLKNLTHAKVEENYHSANRKPGWVSLVSEILHGPDNWKKLRAWSAQRPAMHRQFAGVHHLSSMLEGIVDKNQTHASRPVTNLEVITSGDAFWCQKNRLLPDVTTTARLDPRVLSMQDAFTHLTSLHFKAWFLEEDFTAALTAGLATFLREAVNLEALFLEFVEEKMVGIQENEDLCDILPLIQDVTWKRLRELSLTLTSTEEMFLNLLRRHAGTLKTLRLIDSSLQVAGGSWINILRAIPEILSLEKVYLEALMDGTIEIGSSALFELHEGGAYEQAFEDYLIHGGVFPILDRDEFYASHPQNQQWEDVDSDEEESVQEAATGVAPTTTEDMMAEGMGVGRSFTSTGSTQPPLIEHHPPGTAPSMIQDGQHLPLPGQRWAGSEVSYREP